MKNEILIGGTILMLAAMSAFGADHAGDTYRAGEWSVDGFGSGSVGKYTINNWSGQQVREDVQLGLGAGVNYFFTRSVGLGVDAYSENSTGRFIDSASASLILRLPLAESGFAPYIFGGAGRHFEEVSTWFAQLGGGIEYRFTPHWGVFLDARWVVPDKTKYHGLARLGMRFAF